MRRRSSSIGLLFIFLLTLGSSGCATVYRPIHPAFKERQKLIQKVAVIPPEVSVVKVTFKGDEEPMYDLIGIVGKQSKEEIEEAFRKKGYEIRPVDLSEEELNKNPNLRSDLFRLRELYTKTLEDISKRKQKEFIYSIGPHINRFADLSGADVVVLVRIDAFKKTRGEITKDFFKSILVAVSGVQVHYFHDAVLIQLAVVDGNTGEILWLNATPPGEVDAAKEGELRKAIRNLVQPFPERVGSK